MRYKLSIALLALAFAAGRVWSADAPPLDETQLDAVLQSKASLSEKDAACAQLKRLGTEQSVPVLAVLLTDPDLSHSARYALESMSTPEAGLALLDALDGTSSYTRIGIIDSLGARRQAEAVPKLAVILSGADTDAAIAAAGALGRIGNASAVVALEKAALKSTGALHAAEVDGLLACANESLTDSKEKNALAGFRRLHKGETNDVVRLAAFRGIIRASGNAGARIAVEAIARGDSSDQAAALQLASQLPGGVATTKALCNLLPKASTAVQIALLQALQQRGDASALTSATALLDSPDADVRLGATMALGELGDGSVALLLAKKAASTTGPERDAARQALIDLRRGDVADDMVRVIDTNEPPIQIELIRALGERGDPAPASALLRLAESDNDSVRSAAFAALAMIAGEEQVAGLVELLVKSRDSDARSEAAEALGNTCEHVESQQGHCDVLALAEAARSGPVEARIVLLPICAALTAPETRAALRAALDDSNVAVRNAARRALCDTHDGGLLPDLLILASDPDDKKIHTLAVRGCVRLSTREDSVHLSNDDKLAVLGLALARCQTDDEKRVVLSGLSAVPDKRVFEVLLPEMDDAGVANEAVAAVINVANATSTNHAPEAVKALKKALSLPSVSAEQRKAAEAALKATQ